MKLTALLDVLRGLAPEPLAESWDKVGLHVGDPEVEVRQAMLCIDLTEPVLAEAIDRGCELIVAYHPPIFAPLTAVTTLGVKERIVHTAIRHGLAIYSPHTALDAASGGVTDWLLDALELADRRPIQPSESAASEEVKLVVFVPAENAGDLRTALSQAGAGVIGDYHECSYVLEGFGTFKGGERTNPAVGQKGQLERVAELRLEMVCPKARLAEAVDTIWRVHPYEEPAYDILPLVPPKQTRVTTGAGRMATLQPAMALSDLTQRFKQHLGVAHLSVAAPANLTHVQRLGVCPGAGGSLLESLPAGSLDAFLTGEMRHHDILSAVATGTAVLLAGHSETERPYLPVYRDRLQRAVTEAGHTVQWHLSEADRAPGQVV